MSRQFSLSKNSDYQNFTTNVSQAVQYANQHDSGFYRTEKTFYRSDDDPFSAGYYGLSNFNSISDQKYSTWSTILDF